MKFEKKFSKTIEEMPPDWRDQYLDYKDLKKQIKLIYPDKNASTYTGHRLDLEAMDNGDCNGEMVKNVSIFEEKLEAEIKKFNSFIMLKEKEYNIKWMVILSFFLKLCSFILIFHGKIKRTNDIWYC